MNGTCLNVPLVDWQNQLENGMSCHASEQVSTLWKHSMNDMQYEHHSKQLQAQNLY